jgi:hypothetical protein
MKTGYIYGLASSENNAINYVGMTTSTLNHRRSQHIVDKRVNEKNKWVQSVIGNGHKLLILELEIAPIEILHDLEYDYVNMFKLWGVPLLNVKNGGVDHKQSQSTRIKISQAKKGVSLSESHYLAICKANKLIGLSKRGTKRDPSIGKKTGDKLRGIKKSPMACLKMKEGKIHLRVKIDQLGIDGRLIKTWDSICDCAKENKYSKGNIIKCCKLTHGRSVAYGFKWRYHEETKG